MKILTIVGKVDTRVLAYPLARALSLNGLTAIITDDGAYRRLYHGEAMSGTVSGIDISVGLKMDEELQNSLSNSGIPYDNLVVVSSGYIPTDSTGIIVCHGVDRSMMGMSQAEEEELEQKEKEAAKERAESKGSSGIAGKKKAGGLLGKKKAEVIGEEAVENLGASEASEASGVVSKETEVEEKQIKKDKIVLPEGVPFTEMQISYSSPSRKGLDAIVLKDSFLNYIYSCEERKEITVYQDKNYNKTLAKLLNTTLGIELTEAARLVERSEYIKGKK